MAEILLLKALGSITGKIVDKVSESSERKDNIRLKEVEGRNQKEIAIINGKNTVERIQEEGKIKLESQKLDIKREELQNAHNKEMKEIDYKHELDIKNCDNEHELNLLKRKDESKKVDAEIERMNQNTIENNKREMKKLEGELNIATLKNEIDISQKEIALKQAESQNVYEQAMAKINHTHEENMKNQDTEAERMRLENKNENEFRA